jgi:hypothetical protein
MDSWATIWDKKVCSGYSFENGPVVPPAGKVDNPCYSLENGPVVPLVGLLESLPLQKKSALLMPGSANATSVCAVVFEAHAFAGSLAHNAAVDLAISLAQLPRSTAIILQSKCVYKSPKRIFG